MRNISSNSLSRPVVHVKNGLQVSAHVILLLCGASCNIVFLLLCGALQRETQRDGVKLIVARYTLIVTIEGETEVTIDRYYYQRVGSGYGLCFAAVSRHLLMPSSVACQVVLVFYVAALCAENSLEVYNMMR